MIYILAFVILIILLTAAYAGVRAAPYVPTFQRDVQRMLSLANVKPGETVVDLGAGDGRIVVTAARDYGARAVGYEVSLLPFLVASIRSLRSGKKARILFFDFYRADMKRADVVTCFLTPYAMKRLESKLTRELHEGARLVSYAFRLPTRPPTYIDKPDVRSTPIFIYHF